MPHLQGLSNNPYPEKNHPSSLYFTHFFILILSSHLQLRFPKGIFPTDLINLLRGLWNPEVQYRILKGSPIIPILSRINKIPRIDNCFFMIHFNIVLQSTPRLS